jgi:hypothetical protein
MAKVENLFDRLYGITEDAIKIAKKPFVKKRVLRAIDSEIDKHELSELNLQERERELFNEIVNEKNDAVVAFKEFASNRIKMKDTRETILELKNIREELFGDESGKK